MKVLALALLVLSSFSFSAPSLAADENMTVTGTRIPGGGGGAGVGRMPGANPRPPLSKVDPCQKGPGDCGSVPTAPKIRTPEGEYCLARFATENKPTPLCGSFGELPTFLRGNFSQIFLTCKDKPEYLWKETLLGCSDPT